MAVERESNSNPFDPSWYQPLQWQPYATFINYCIVEGLPCPNVGDAALQNAFKISKALQ
jgi:hypothetical protein